MNELTFNEVSRVTGGVLKKKTRLLIIAFLLIFIVIIVFIFLIAIGYISFSDPLNNG